MAKSHIGFGNLKQEKNQVLFSKSEKDFNMDLKEATQILKEYEEIEEYDYDLSLSAVEEIQTLVEALSCMHNELLRLQNITTNRTLPKTTKDCPVNCPYLLMNDHYAGCELGKRMGGPIMDYEGGEARLGICPVRWVNIEELRELYPQHEGGEATKKEPAEWTSIDCPACGHPFIARDKWGLFCFIDGCGWSDYEGGEGEING